MWNRTCGLGLVGQDLNCPERGFNFLLRGLMVELRGLNFDVCGLICHLRGLKLVFDRWTTADCSRALGANRIPVGLGFLPRIMGVFSLL